MPALGVNRKRAREWEMHSEGGVGKGISHSQKRASRSFRRNSISIELQTSLCIQHSNHDLHSYCTVILTLYGMKERKKEEEKGEENGRVEPFSRTTFLPLERRA